jgi:1-acyl-sn-glycerol-3-phosphate acyltransferase
MFYRLLATLTHAIFRIWFALEYTGRENVPARGPVVVAGNHPSYLDPVLVGIGIHRRVFFMAWDRLFSIPLLGALLRQVGAFPVRLGTRDPNAFEAALAILREDGVLGIFPEAGRSSAGPMNPLKTGAARLAIATGAPIVPVTITGAYDAWPSSRTLPQPRKITVKYHPPIVLDPVEVVARRDDRAFHEEITERLRETIERRLLPSLDADERKRRAFAGPASPLRVYELGPAIAAIVGVAVSGAGGAGPAWIGPAWIGPAWIGPAWTGPAWMLAIAGAHLAYILADIWWLPQGRLAKAVRDLVTPIAAFALGPSLGRAAGIAVPEWVTLGAVGVGLGLAINWTNYYKAQRYTRGAILAYLAAFGLALRFGHPYAPHLAFAVFSAAYAIAWRPLFWPFFAAVSAAYAVGLAWAGGMSSLSVAAAHALLGIAVVGYLRLVRFSAHDGRMI